MKTPAFAFTTLCLAFSLTACGGSDGGSSTSITNPNNPTTPTSPTNPTNTNSPIQNGVFNYTVFDIYTDSANKSAWGKIEETIMNGSFTEVASTVVGASPYNDYFDGDVDFRAGKGFFSAITDTQYAALLGKSAKIIDDDTIQVTYPNTPLSESLDVVSFDISGKGKNATYTNPVKSGVFTDLDYYSQYFKAINYSYPQGSKCYVVNTKTNLPSYFFYHVGSNNQTTLQQWVADEQLTNVENEVSGATEKVRATDIVYENIGQNNELPAVHFKDQFGNYHAAVKYQNSIYDADYNDGVNYETPVSNADLNKGAVACWSYNKVAADYLVEQMKLNYGK